MHENHAHDGLPMRPRRHGSMDLLLATNELQAAVHRLIDDSMSYINNTLIEIPGLYAQLWMAMDSYRSAAASSSARSRPPMWIEALDAAEELGTFLDSLSYGSAGNTGAQLRALTNQAWTVDDISHVQYLTRKLTRYGDDIERLLNAEHVKELTVPCPACGVEYVERRNGSGEIVWSYALQASAEHGCTCQSCGYHWAPNQLMELATDAGLPTPEGVTR